MPILKRRHKYIKMYRPNGMKYSNGDTMTSYVDAIGSAEDNFMKEFGYIPISDHSLLKF